METNREARFNISHGGATRDKPHALCKTKTRMSPAYPIARAAALRVQAHFAHHRSLLQGESREQSAPPPAVEAIEPIIDVAFWASLRREEGITPKISLALVPPEHAGQPLLFAHPLALDPAALARLAPAVERPGIHLGVWWDGRELRVWGTTRTLPPMCFVLEVVTSGLLVVKHRSEPFGKFVNVAVLEGDQVKIIDERGADWPDCPGVMRSLLGFASPDRQGESVDILVQLSASMRTHGRGGALLVVPAGSSEWRESIVAPMLYGVEPPVADLARLKAREPAEYRLHEWQEELRDAVDAIAGLTAVDGATLLSDRYELLAFGAKITRRRGNPPVELATVTEPIEGSQSQTMHPSQFGGTRHLSAAQFVHDQRDALALVASQDGHFTVFQWSPCEEMVHAHRVEALLL